LNETPNNKTPPSGGLEAHREALLCHARHLCRSEDEAQEVVQETYARALKHPPSAEVQNHRAWMRKILSNLVIDRARKKKIRQHTSDELDELETREYEPEPAWSRVTAVELADAIDRLNEKHQAVVRLFYFDRKSQTEIAEALNIKPGTVGSRSNRAIEALRKILKKKVPE
jgi:RNA polymerase sigma-70 factor, ECF subfamily